MDRAGLVGSDGETHQGIFDLSFLSAIPNMSIIAPKNMWELKDRTGVCRVLTEGRLPFAIQEVRPTEA